MKWNDSDWANDIFAAAACNWTPAPARHYACVLFVPVLSDPEAAQLCSAILSDAELQQAERFLTEENRAHFIQRRAFRRHCGALALAAPPPLSQIQFQETEKGRPYLPDLPDVWFSFSSCPLGFLAAWSSTHGVGVDIEDPARGLEAVELAQRFFSQAEAKAVREVDGLARQRTFFQLWSLKEAALKSIGEGLPYGLDAFAFELVPDLRIAHAPRDHGGPERFDPHIIESTDRCAALVLRERLFQAQKSL
jgi:phosphopantetheine--protein transferase-like protein